MAPEEERGVEQRAGAGEDCAGDRGGGEGVGVRGEEVVGDGDEAEGGGGEGWSGDRLDFGWEMRWRENVQEYALSLEDGVTTGEAEERGEGVSGSEEGDYEDGEDGGREA